VIVTATELANDSKAILDRVIQGGETVEVQRHGRSVAEIRPKVGVDRTELLRLLHGRGFSEADSRQLRKVMEGASEVIGYAGGD
jgi:antitoxin (DNA-binding transcriptional repressor) of toxin-antitoxin stability system